MFSSLAAIWIALGTNIVGVQNRQMDGESRRRRRVAARRAAGAASRGWSGRNAASRPVPSAARLQLGHISFLSTIAYAMTGFETIGLMGGEIRHPKRDLKRAAWIASVFTTLFYAGTTMALLVVLRPENISELNGLAQAGTAAGQTLGASWLSPAIALLVMATAIGQFGGLGSSVSRMPFAAGVDHLMPAAFAKIHPRWATPYVSILRLRRARVRSVDPEPGRRYDARGVSDPRIADGDRGLPALLLHVRQFLESGTPGERDFGMRVSPRWRFCAPSCRLPRSTTSGCSSSNSLRERSR